MRAGEPVCYRGLIMAEREPAGPFCFEWVGFPEAPADVEESAPDRSARRSRTADFVRPRIERSLVPTYAAHGPDYREPADEG